MVAVLHYFYLLGLTQQLPHVLYQGPPPGIFEVPTSKRGPRTKYLGMRLHLVLFKFREPVNLRPQLTFFVCLWNASTSQRTNDFIAGLLLLLLLHSFFQHRFVLEILKPCKKVLLLQLKFNHVKDLHYQLLLTMSCEPENIWIEKTVLQN